MPLYVSNALEDAGMNLHSEWIALLFSFAVFMWFMVINLISFKFSEVSQWVFTLIQTIPLLVLPIIGLVNAGDVSGTILNKTGFSTDGLTGTSPWLATIAGISAIAFAYDGFYTSASLRNEMKDPKKLGRGLVGGIIGVSVIYLFLTIGFNVAGNGSLYGMYKFMNGKWFKIFNVFIAVGIMGIVNSFAMSSPKQFRDMSFAGELSVTNWIQKIVYRKRIDVNSKIQKYVASWLFITIVTSLFFIIFGCSAILWYKDGYSWGSIADNFDKIPNGFTGNELPDSYFNISELPDNGFWRQYAGGSLYTFADVLTNFTSLLMFIIISTAVLGAIINRKTKKVEVEKSRYFLPAAWIVVVINYSAGLYMIIEAIVNSTGFNGSDGLSSLINLMVFLAIMGISIIPALLSTTGLSKRIINFNKK